MRVCSLTGSVRPLLTLYNTYFHLTDPRQPYQSRIIDEHAFAVVSVGYDGFAMQRTVGHVHEFFGVVREDHVGDSSGCGR